MIFWPFCAFIWFKNIEKMLLQMTSDFLQLESTIAYVNVKYMNLAVLCFSLLDKMMYVQRSFNNILFQNYLPQQNFHCYDL
jgi:hypothetical protein